MNVAAIVRRRVSEHAKTSRPEPADPADGPVDYHGLNRSRS